MGSFTSILAVAVAAVFVAATLLPIFPATSRWIRIFDFPRVQIGIGLALAGALLLLDMPADSALHIGALGAVAACLGYQTRQIIRYSPIFPCQAMDAAGGNPDTDFRMLIANVLMENRNSGALLERVREVDPDIAVFVETNEWWDGALTELAADYPYSLRQPQDNHYGMILYSRLPLIDPEIRFIIREEIPSIRTGVRLQTGEVFSFYALHPVPPPLADTEMRDAEILVVAKEIRRFGKPAIVAGDLNDVSWSRTTQLFMRISRLLDPRIGRGFFASFNAKNPLMRWPLDHVFHDASFKVNNIRLLKSFGSDHFPVFVSLRYQPRIETGDAPEPADDGDMKEAAALIEAGENAEPGENDYPNSPTPEGQTGRTNPTGKAG